MIRKLLYLSLACLLAVLEGAAEGRTKTVYRIDVKEEIGPKAWRLADKSFREAGRTGADYVLIHMNTYGGMVVYADSLRTRILNFPRPVWAFIDNNAASAGALISLACDRIYMREGGSIGAATVVNQGGEAMPDKYQSYMRSMIRSTAQSHGRDTIVQDGDTLYRWKRDPRIAEAMVDQSIVVEGVSDSGRVVTFTPHEAMEHGFCDGLAETVDEVIRAEGVEDYVVMAYEPGFTDHVIGFLINPVVRALIVMLVIGGIYFELQTPGIGFPLAAACVGCLLYFAPLYLEGLATHWEILAFLAGVILLLVEVFVLPGFGVAGISGSVLVLGSLILAATDRFSWDFMDAFLESLLESLLLVLTSTLVALGSAMWLGARLLGSHRWPLALHAEQQVADGYVGVDMEAAGLVGSHGRCLTDLRPSGKVEAGGQVLDAVSLFGDYIPKGTEVCIRKYQSGQVYVERG